MTFSTVSRGIPRSGVSRVELEEELRPERFVGRAPEQVDAFLAEWVDPVLERYASDLGDRKAPELHV